MSNPCTQLRSLILLTVVLCSIFLAACSGVGTIAGQQLGATVNSSAPSSPPGNLNRATTRPNAKARFIYTISQNPLQISVFRVDSSGGLALLSRTGIANGDSAGLLMADPLGHFLYATSGQRFSGGSRTEWLMVYRVAPDTGAVTLTQTLTFPGGGPAFGWTTTRDGRFLFAPIYSVLQSSGNNMLAVYNVEADTGLLHPVPGSPFDDGFTRGSPPALATDSNAQFLYAFSDVLCPSCPGNATGEVHQFLIDQATGGLAPNASVSAGIETLPGFSLVWGYQRILLTPDDKFTYLSTFHSSAATGPITAITGFLPNSWTVLPNMPFNFGRITPYTLMDPSGQVLWVDSDLGSPDRRTDAYWILNDGSLQKFGSSNGTWPVVTDAAGTLGFGFDSEVSSVAEIISYRLDPTSGTVTPLSTVSAPGVVSIAVVSQ